MVMVGELEFLGRLQRSGLSKLWVVDAGTARVDIPDIRQISHHQQQNGFFLSK
jgi:hypothetical protein